MRTIDPKNLHNSGEFEVNDKEEAFRMAEKLTEVGYEVSKPQSFDGGKTFNFTASEAE